MVRIAPAAVVALLGTLAPPGAALVPQGPEFRVDDGAVSSASCPLVAGGANGSFEVVWANDGYPRPRNSHAWSRHFSWQGLPTEPPRVLATSGAFPEELVRLPGGGFRALWRQYSAAFTSVWRTILLGDFGGPVTALKRLRATPYFSVLSIRPGGGYVGGWQLQRDAFALQLFDAGGRRVGSVRQLNATPLVTLGAVGFVHLPDGGFIAVWSGQAMRSDGTLDSFLFTRAHSPGGEAIGDENVLASAPPNAPGGVVGFSGVALPDGRVALAWRTELFGIQTIYLQVLSRSGAPLLPPTLVVEGDIESVGAYLQDVAVGPDGQIAVLWQRESEFCLDSDFQCDHLFAQLFDSSGTSVGEPVAVDTPATEPFDKALCGSLTAAGAGFVASWLGLDADASFQSVIFARRLAVTP